MKSIQELEEFIFNDSLTLLQSLSETTQPIWGSMNAQQMIEHVALAVGVSNGKIDLPLLTPSEKVDRVRELNLLGNRPLPKDFKNPALPNEPMPLKEASLEASITHLYNELNLFQTLFKNTLDAKRTHNIFGPLNYEQWLWFHYKHLHHHWAQFGLIPYVERFG
ncbi:MAG: hypothetical protein ACK5UI_06735 [Bacteroidota bacterium]|jgi:hydroxymethylglutaryl-CoA reductase